MTGNPYLLSKISRNFRKKFHILSYLMIHNRYRTSLTIYFCQWHQKCPGRIRILSRIRILLDLIPDPQFRIVDPRSGSGSKINNYGSATLVNSVKISDPDRRSGMTWTILWPTWRSWRTRPRRLRRLSSPIMGKEICLSWPGGYSGMIPCRECGIH